MYLFVTEEPQNLCGQCFERSCPPVSQRIRELLVTRTSFFNDIRTLLKYFWFKNWSEFFLFILTEYVPLKKINSS
ncbi:hypothetical protein MiYa_04707 [Microcystis aeruginosa NIES-2519]|uniref:Uncharacterized protein n=1 Tax=Microcystis aeruginosa NIES-2519 TaxID=2303981 RepID=A0A5A5RDL6_MICAE|nr:hypothetical protein MiYa_04707 [Microcystis aeruginosa NIES-2519]GCA86606.1 hypothetical protein MiHa_04600 [Microcystis aeruginosa NIES-2522]